MSFAIQVLIAFSYLLVLGLKYYLKNTYRTALYIKHAMLNAATTTKAHIVMSIIIQSRT